MKNLIVMLAVMLAFVCFTSVSVSAGNGFGVQSVLVQPQFAQVQAAGCNQAFAQQVVVQRVQQVHQFQPQQVVVQRVQPQRVVVQQQQFRPQRVVVQQASPQIDVGFQRAGIFGLRRSPFVSIR